MKRLLALSLLLLLTGCHVSSRVAMEGNGGRGAYNKAVQRTTNEEMLLNLVRLRYCDTPYFLDVSTVTTQFTYGAKGTALVPIPGLTTLNPGELGGELSWQNQPTIQYTPLQGQTYASQLMQPIDLQIIQQLIFAGWDIDRVFQLVMQNFDTLPNANQASGPSPETIPEYEQFFRMTQLLRCIQLDGRLQIGVKHGDKEAKEPHETTKSMQIRFPACKSGCNLVEMLPNTKQHGETYVIDVNLGYDESGDVGVLPRSILGCMYYLSLGVNTPPRDLRSGVVWATRKPDGSIFDWNSVVGNLMQIKYSPTDPHHPYIKVRYRDHWFYIDDRDVESKRTFVLLQQLYNLQSVNTQSQPPLLTIPLGV